MIPLKRIQQIYHILEQQPATIEDIWAQLKKAGYKVERRQLYWDLQALEKHYLRSDEELVVNAGQFNRQTFILKRKLTPKAVTVFDINTYQLGINSLPLVFNMERAASLKKFKRILDEQVLQQRKMAYTHLAAPKLLNTHFYEAHYPLAFQQALEDFIWAIANNKIICIQQFYGDATSLYKKIELPFFIKPISIIYHRGDFLMAGFDTEYQMFTSLNISKIEAYQLQNKTFAYKKLQAQFQQILGERFGITNNINNKVYQIELEFSSLTGEFASKYHWHHSQVFSLLPNGNWKCVFSCGINRELAGWIFHWLGNVRVVKPKLLKDLCRQQLSMMTNHLEEKSPMSYTNIFKPD